MQDKRWVFPWRKKEVSVGSQFDKIGQVLQVIKPVGRKFTDALNLVQEFGPSIVTEEMLVDGWPSDKKVVANSRRYGKGDLDRSDYYGCHEYVQTNGGADR